MIDGKKVLAIIPARGGSKGIPNKNITNLAGKPLIAYSITAAKNSKYIDDVFVSTDSMQIAEAAKEYGVIVPNLRPPELATDNARTIDVIVHCIDILKSSGRLYDIIVLLQPTQPLRIVSDIDESLETFIGNGCISLVSVSETTDSPVLVRTISKNGRLKRVLENANSTVRRQEMKKYYRVNGSVYINLASEINPELSLNDNKMPYIMSRSRAVDIDEEFDLLIAEAILSSQNLIDL